MNIKTLNNKYMKKIQRKNKIKLKRKMILKIKVK